MALEIAFDPYSLAAPNLDADPAEFEQYVDELVLWSSLRSDGLARLTISADTVGVLFDEERYPLPARLSAYLRDAGIDHLTTADIARVVTSLLESPTIEDIHGVDAALWDPFAIRPDLAAARGYPRLSQELVRCLELLACVLNFDSGPQTDLWLASLGSDCPGCYLELEGTLVDVQLRDSNSISSALPLPSNLQLNVATSFGSFIHAVDPVLVWTKGSNEHAVITAIRVAVVQRSNGIWDAGEPFSVGREFVSTLKTYSFLEDEGRARRLLSACVDTVLGERLSDVHALRTGRGGSNPQRLRGQDKAMRRDVDDQFHLHYWERPGGGPELGSVGPHNDFSIPS